MKKVSFYFFTASVIFIILIFFAFFRFNDKKLHIVVCDVGQGDAILITTPNQAQILIDGGPDKAVLECLARHMPFWDRSLDAVIMTHPDADHMFGLIDVIERYKLSAFYSETVKSDSDGFKLLEAKLAEEKLSAIDLNKGDILKDKSGLNLKILWPRLNINEKVDHNTANLDLNSLSVVTLLTFGNFSMLLTGDAEKEVMEEISSDAGDINILKVPHHGSRNGLSSLFLKNIRPEEAVISVGEKNRYGHPASETLDELVKSRSKIFRTDTNGEVEIVTDGKSYNIKSSR